MASAESSEASCVTDPNFAVICSFIEQFGKHCGLETPDIASLQDWIDNTQDVPKPLVDLHVKLLRKARKSVNPEKWERAVVKFCHTYSNQDAWELERIGYKKARAAIKLRVLKALLEIQFDKNQRFKNEVNKLPANELRLQPLGRDKAGLTYWCQLDEECNIRVYREDLEEENWELIAKNREDMVAIINTLTDGEVGDIPISEEDSNSLETLEKPTIDTGQEETNPINGDALENEKNKNDLEDKQKLEKEDDDEQDDEEDDDDEEEDGEEGDDDDEGEEESEEEESESESEEEEEEEDKQNDDQKETIISKENGKSSDTCASVPETVITPVTGTVPVSVSEPEPSSATKSVPAQSVVQSVNREIIQKSEKSVEVPVNEEGTVNSTESVKNGTTTHQDGTNTTIKSIETPVITTSPLKIVNINELKQDPEKKVETHSKVPVINNTFGVTTDLSSGHNKPSVKPIDQLAANLGRIKADKPFSKLDKIAESLAKGQASAFGIQSNGEDDVRLQQPRNHRGIDLSTSPRGWENANDQPVDFSGMDLSNRKSTASVFKPQDLTASHHQQQLSMDLSTRKSAAKLHPNLSQYEPQAAFDVRTHAMLRNHALVADLSKRHVPYQPYELPSNVAGVPYGASPQQRLPSYAMVPDPSKLSTLRMAQSSSPLKRPLDTMEPSDAVLKRMRTDNIRGVDPAKLAPHWRDEVGEAIEDPVMMVRGEGSGADCDAVFGEEIEEPVMYFYGEGSGADCETGNSPTNEEQKDEEKLSPSKTKYKLGVQIFNQPSTVVTPKRSSRWDVGGPSGPNENSAEQISPPKFFFGPNCIAYGAASKPRVNEEDNGLKNDSKIVPKNDDESTKKDLCDKTDVKSEVAKSADTISSCAVENVSEIKTEDEKSSLDDLKTVEKELVKTVKTENEVKQQNEESKASCEPSKHLENTNTQESMNSETKSETDLEKSDKSECSVSFGKEDSKMTETTENSDSSEPMQIATQADSELSWLQTAQSDDAVDNAQIPQLESSLQLPQITDEAKSKKPLDISHKDESNSSKSERVEEKETLKEQSRVSEKVLADVDNPVDEVASDDLSCSQSVDRDDGNKLLDQPISAENSNTSDSNVESKDSISNLTISKNDEESSSIVPPINSLSMFGTEATHTQTKGKPELVEEKIENVASDVLDISKSERSTADKLSDNQTATNFSPGEKKKSEDASTFATQIDEPTKCTSPTSKDIDVDLDDTLKMEETFSAENTSRLRLNESEINEKMDESISNQDNSDFQGNIDEESSVSEKSNVNENKKNDNKCNITNDHGVEEEKSDLPPPSRLTIENVRRKAAEAEQSNTDSLYFKKIDERSVESSLIVECASIRTDDDMTMITDDKSEKSSDSNKDDALESPPDIIMNEKDSPAGNDNVLEDQARAEQSKDTTESSEKSSKEGIEQQIPKQDSSLQAGNTLLEKTNIDQKFTIPKNIDDVESVESKTSDISVVNDPSQAKSIDNLTNTISDKNKANKESEIKISLESPVTDKSTQNTNVELKKCDDSDKLELKVIDKSDIMDGSGKESDCKPLVAYYDSDSIDESNADCSTSGKKADVKPTQVEVVKEQDIATDSSKNHEHNVEDLQTLEKVEKSEESSETIVKDENSEKLEETKVTASTKEPKSFENLSESVSQLSEGHKNLDTTCEATPKQDLEKVIPNHESKLEKSSLVNNAETLDEDSVTGELESRAANTSIPSSENEIIAEKEPIIQSWKKQTVIDDLSKTIIDSKKKTHPTVKENIISAYQTQMPSSIAVEKNVEDMNVKQISSTKIDELYHKVDLSHTNYVNENLDANTFKCSKRLPEEELYDDRPIKHLHTEEQQDSSAPVCSKSTSETISDIPANDKVSDNQKIVENEIVEQFPTENKIKSQETCKEKPADLEHVPQPQEVSEITSKDQESVQSETLAVSETITATQNENKERFSEISKGITQVEQTDLFSEKVDESKLTPLESTVASKIDEAPVVETVPTQQTMQMTESHETPSNVIDTALEKDQSSVQTEDSSEILTEKHNVNADQISTLVEETPTIASTQLTELAEPKEHLPKESEPKESHVAPPLPQESIETAEQASSDDDSIGAGGNDESMFDAPPVDDEPPVADSESAEDIVASVGGIRVAEVPDIATAGAWKLDSTMEPPAEIVQRVTRQSRKRRNSCQAQDNDSEDLGSSKMQSDEDEGTAGKRMKLKAKRTVDQQFREKVEKSRKISASSEDDFKKQESEEAAIDGAAGYDSQDKEGEASTVGTVAAATAKKGKRPKARKRKGGKKGRATALKPPAPATNEAAGESNEQPEADPSVKKEDANEGETAAKAPEKKQRKKRNMLLGLDIAESEAAGIGDSETPVRASRRIAQLRIKKEADKSLIEEMAKAQVESEKKPKKHDKSGKHKEEKKDKKKKRKKESEEDEKMMKDLEKEDKKKKKKRKKKKLGAKFNHDHPWQSSSGSSSSDENEEHEEEEEEIETDEDRLVFKSDHEFSPESDLEKEEESEPMRRARTAQKDDDEAEDEYACQKCSKSDHPEWILLCDSCDQGWHCSCLRPALMIIPEGDWFCPPCQHYTLVTKLQEKLKIFDIQTKKHENELLRKKRIAYVGISMDNVLQKAEDSTRTRRPSRGSSLDDDDDSSDGSSSDESSSEESSSDESEPVYQLRERRTANASYKFTEYDELIKDAIKGDFESSKGAGNQGRGKDIATIVNAAEKQEKEYEAMKQLKAEEEYEGDAKSEKDSDEDFKVEKEDDNDDGDDDNDSLTRVKVTAKARMLARKKPRKLNSLDFSSEEDDPYSDEDFKGSSSEEEEEDPDEQLSSSDDSDLAGRRRGRGRDKRPVRRSTRARTTRYDEDFINDDSDDSDRPKRKKSRGSWAAESESEESDNSWRQKKKNRKSSSSRRSAPKIKASKKKKKRKRIITQDSDEEEETQKFEEVPPVIPPVAQEVQPIQQSQPLQPVEHVQQTIPAEAATSDPVSGPVPIINQSLGVNQDIEMPFDQSQPMEQVPVPQTIVPPVAEDLVPPVAYDALPVPQATPMEQGDQYKKKKKEPKEKKIRRKIVYGRIRDENEIAEEELNTGRRTRGRKISYLDAMPSDSDEELKKALRKTEDAEDEFVVHDNEDIIDDAEKDSDDDVYSPKHQVVRGKSATPRGGGRGRGNKRSPGAKRKSVSDDGTPKQRKKPGPKPGTKQKRQSKSGDDFDSSLINNDMLVGMQVDDSVQGILPGNVTVEGSLASLDEQLVDQLMMDGDYDQRPIDMDALELAKKKKKEEREAKKMEKARQKALEILAAESMNPDGTDGDVPKKKKRGRRSKAEILAEQMRRESAGLPPEMPPQVQEPPPPQPQQQPIQQLPTQPPMIPVPVQQMAAQHMQVPVPPPTEIINATGMPTMQPIPGMGPVEQPPPACDPRMMENNPMIPMISPQSSDYSMDSSPMFNPDGSPLKPKRRGRGKGKKTLAMEAARAAEAAAKVAAEQGLMGIPPTPVESGPNPELSKLEEMQASVLPPGSNVSPSTPPTTSNPASVYSSMPPQQPGSQQSSVITRMLQTQPPVPSSAQSFTSAAVAMSHKYFGGPPNPTGPMMGGPRPGFDMQNRGRIPSPYRQPGSQQPMPPHFPPVRAGTPPNMRLRVPGSAPGMYGCMMDPSPSGGGPITINSRGPPPPGGPPGGADRSSPLGPGPPGGPPLNMIPPSAGSPLAKGGPTPPPPYVRRFAEPQMGSPRHPLPAFTNANMQQPSPPTSRTPGNFSPYHPPPPPNYHYGPAYTGPPSMPMNEETGTGAPYQPTPYPGAADQQQHYPPAGAEQTLPPPPRPGPPQTQSGPPPRAQMPPGPHPPHPGHAGHPGHPGHPYGKRDEEGSSGEFGGLVSYFSSQREDDIES
ncbi:titin homolog [Trichogramma pretiosum]|uniref:titin homolog n=1 Tax=Trichogramma pretiosum TaxID=7493 RepID=UPI000C71B584|nr:titin homolog [Trichogramma pretiosum]XP_023318650.1 titin homolog [Trichogramma pretiosum]